jgi:hypothetical protein
VTLFPGASLLLLAGSLGLFVLAQRWLHRELQYLLLLVTRRPGLALGIFSLLFFPGVFLHESSHYLVARFLRVRTGRFSLLPKAMPNRTLRLGYVETAAADPLRDALIGMAPLISGGVVVAWLGLNQLGLAPLFEMAASNQWNQVWATLAALPGLPDFWLWFYLTFAVSSTMLPSASDRRAWLPVALVLIGLFGLVVLAGAGPWMAVNLAPGFEQALRSLAIVFIVGLIIHVAMGLPIALIRGFVTRLAG